MAQKLLHYEVIERIGEGARSVIYSVIDPTTTRRFALKHVVRAEAKDIRFIEQMESEFEISKNFDHPNLRRSYQLKVVRNMLLQVREAFLVMDLVSGKAMDIGCPRDVGVVIESFSQVAQALKAMHAMGIVHCDLKPNNIIRNDAGGVKVIDYGQSCKIGTIKERIQGTPDYIAPEQVNRKPVTVHTDVFNFGATLYWILTGKNIPTLYTVNRKGDNSFLMDDRIAAPAELNPKVPMALSNLVIECIATNPRRRPADMDEVLTRLELAKHVYQKGASEHTPPGK